MKLKPYLPLIVLAVFSCILLVGAPVYFLVDTFHSEYPREVSTKISLSLKQGLGFAIVALILVWIGAAVDFGISRIKQKAARVGVSLFVYVTPFFTCGLLAMLILFTMGSFAPPPHWHKLPNAPTTAVKIAAIGEDSLALQTETGEYYSCDTTHTSECWKVMSTTPPSIFQNENRSITEIQDAPAVTLRGDMLSLQGVKFPTPGGYMHVHYALLDTGTVWVLEQKVISKEDSGFGSALFLTLIILPGLITLVGICLGAGVSSIARWLAGRILHGAETT